MNKKLLILLSLCVIIFAGFVFFKDNYNPKNNTNEPTPTQIISKNIKLKIYYEDGSTTNYETQIDDDESAFDILQAAANNQEIPLDYQQYDFGVFVKSINGVANTNEKSWIYFVNESSPEVGADNYSVKDGDVIEWKYIEPSF